MISDDLKSLAQLKSSIIASLECRPIATFWLGGVAG